MVSLSTLPFNWFDLVIVVVIIVGMQRGRKHGFSEELICLLKWLTIVFACAVMYLPLGTAIAASPAFNILSGYLIAYLGTALVIAALFAVLKSVLGGKLVGSDVFGRSEFYLGMFAGMIRFTCMLIVALALLGARAYNPAEIRDDVKYQNDVYGSNFFPKLYTVQAQVFDSSLSGPWIKTNLTFLLIKPTAPEKKELKRKDEMPLQ
jgi:uncharacterized membrane protein required for colicin V production